MLLDAQVVHGLIEHRNNVEAKIVTDQKNIIATPFQFSPQLLEKTIEAAMDIDINHTLPLSTYIIPLK